MGKVTMKDIAREAGVSIATVSYVLNKNEKEKIPEETREKILRISQKLNYIPNLAARSLVKKKSYLIGILIVRDYKNEGEWKNCCYTEFINNLEKMLGTKGYHVIISNIDSSNPQLDIISERELDGVFVININKDFFYDISNKFNVPIIIVDSCIDDIIFHKIIPDLEDAIGYAKRCFNNKKLFLICDSYNDENIMSSIKVSFSGKEENICIVDSLENMEEFAMKHKEDNIIVINEFLGSVAARYVKPENMAVICICGSSYLIPKEAKKIIISNEKKARAAMDTMIDYINKEYYNYKYTYIKPDK